MVGVIQGRVQGASLGELVAIIDSKDKRTALLKDLIETEERASADLARLNTGNVQLGKDRKALKAEREAFEEASAKTKAVHAKENERISKWVADLNAVQSRLDGEVSDKRKEAKLDRAEAKRDRIAAEQTLEEARQMRAVADAAQARADAAQSAVNEREQSVAAASEEISRIVEGLR